MLTLHHAWASTCSQKVRLALAEKGIPWLSRALNLRKLEHLDDAFLALNPAGMVPVLDHDGFVLTESTVINEYLEDAFPDVSLLPRAPQARARVRAWSRFIDDVPTDAIKVPSYQTNLRAFLVQLSADERERIRARMPNRKTADRWLRIAAGGAGLADTELADAFARLRETLDRMESALAGHAWLAGGDYTLADVNMAPFIVRLPQFAELGGLAGWPRARAWLARLTARPAFAAARFIDQSQPSVAN
jgi:glutathione S-transferase